MEFRVLGAVAVYDDARGLLPLGGAQQRRLLAVLLANAGRVVSVDRLVGALWPDLAPEDAVRTVRTYVARLRRVIGAAVVTSEPGYVLELAGHVLDASEFERSMSAARSAADDDAVGHYERALSWWSGAAYDEMQEEWWARPEVERLEELRLVAVEERVDRLLGLGRFGEAVPELRDVVERHPLRERPVGQLMVALQHTGRLAEALRVYERFRGTLLDELGLDPSDELRALDSSIALEGSVAAPLRPVATSRGNLPAAPTELVGREQDMERLVGTVAAGRIVTLIGPGGVGKTALASTVGGALAERFADGAWFVDLAATVEERDVIHLAASDLGLVTSTPRPTAAWLAAVLRDQRRLIVLDNCEHVLNVAGELAQRVISLCPGVAIIATSREALGLSGERVMLVPPLSLLATESLSDSARLFRRRVADADGEAALAGVDDRVIEDICARLDGLPLALELAAAHVPALGVHELSARLARKIAMFDRRRGAMRHQSLVALVTWSYELLSEHERRVFERLALFVDGFDLPAAAAVCGEEGDELVIEAAIVALVDKSLVNVHHNQLGGRVRYRQLETIRRFAVDRLDERGDGVTVADRLVAHYVALVEELDHAVRGPDEMRSTGSFASDWNNLRIAFSRSVETGELDAAVAMVWRVSWWATQHLRMEIGDWAEIVLGLPGVDAHPDHAIVLAVAAEFKRRQLRMPDYDELVARGRSVESLRGPASEPWVTQVGFWQEVMFATVHPSPAAATIGARSSGQAFWEVMSAWCEAFIPALRSAERPANEIDTADRTLIERCVELAAAWGNPTLVAKTQHLLGRSLRTADPHRAIELLQASFAQARSVGNEDVAAYARADLAIILTDVGRAADAAELLREGMEEHRLAGDKYPRWSLCLASVRTLAALDQHRAAAFVVSRLWTNPPAALWMRTYLPDDLLDRIRDAMGNEQFESTVQEGIRGKVPAVMDEVLTAIRTCTPWWPDQAT